MPQSNLCTSCSQGQRPEVFVVSLSGGCCLCGVSENEASRCGTCDERTTEACKSCGEFNGYFELRRTDDDCCRYVYTFPKDANTGLGPCGAKELELRVNARDQEERVDVCVRILFDQGEGAVRPVSWGKTCEKDCCAIGDLRRRTTNRKCCWPHKVTVTPVPVPDLVPPPLEWQKGDPADLNDAPYWPTLDLDLMEESPHAPVRYSNGELQLRVNDIGSKGFGVPWGHTRIYSNRLSNSFDFGNGYNWMVLEWPELLSLKTNPAEIQKATKVPENGPTSTHPDFGKATGCAIVLLRGNRNALWFDQFERPNKKTWWRARFAGRHQLEHDPKASTFCLAAPNGHLWEFFDFTPPHSKAFAKRSVEDRKKIAPGKLKQHTGPGGQVLTLEYKNCRVEKVTRGNETFDYTYIADAKNPNHGRLDKVAFSRISGQFAGNISRAVYTYYKPNERHGLPGDLKTAQVEYWDNGWKSRPNSYQYYAYYTEPIGTYCQGMLKAVMSPESVSRMHRLGGDPRRSGPLDASYTDLWIEYWTEHNLAQRITGEERRETIGRVHKVIMDRGGRTHRFYYRINKALRADDDKNNTWKFKTVEERNDGNQRIVYTNYLGRVILSNLTDVTIKRWWQNWFHYHNVADDACRLHFKAAPSALKGYEEGGRTKVWGEPIITTGLDISHRRDHGFVQRLEYDHNHFYWIKKVVHSKGVRGRLNWNWDHFKDMVVYFYGRRKTDRIDIDYVNYTTTPAPEKLTDTRQGTKKTKRWKSVTFEPAWHGTGQLARLTTTNPKVPTDEGGTGKETTIVSTYDIFGNTKSVKDERGMLVTAEYHVELGLPHTRKATGRHPDGRFETLETNYRYDRFGRVTHDLGPSHRAVIDPIRGAEMTVRRANWMVHHDQTGEVIIAQGYVAGGRDQVINPVQLIRRDLAGRVTETIAAILRSDPRVAPPSVTLPKRRWVRRQCNEYDAQNRLEATEVYSDIQNGHHDLTVFQYDTMYRVKSMRDPSGAVHAQEYDARGLLTRRLMGSKPDSLVPITTYVYDNDQERGLGDGHLTREIHHPSGDRRDDRVSVMKYDWRGLMIEREVVAGSGTKARFEYSNDNSLLLVESHGGRGDALLGRDGPAPKGSYRVFQHKHRNILGRIYSVQEIRSRQINGIVADDKNIVLDERFWHDAGGLLVKHRPAGQTAFTKYVYDGFGRQVAQYLAYTDIDRNPWSIRNDVVLEQSVSTFDPAGNTRRVTVTRRPPKRVAALTTGTLGGAPGVRHEISEMAYDPMGRLTVGMARGSSDLTTPLVTWVRYNERGEKAEVTSPKGNVKQFQYDDAARVTEVIDNALRTTTYEYKYGLLYKLRVAPTRNTPMDLPPGARPETEKVLTYTYGADAINTSLVSSITYPDGGGSESFEYNRLGEVTRRVDPNGTRHLLTYDRHGRLIVDAIEQYGPGVDKEIVSIGYVYDGRGRLWMAATSSNYRHRLRGYNRDLVRYYYSAFDQVTEEIQDHGFRGDWGPAFEWHHRDRTKSPKHRGGTSEAQVKYIYANQDTNYEPESPQIGGNTVRLHAVKYPLARYHGSSNYLLNSNPAQIKRKRWGLYRELQYDYVLKHDQALSRATELLDVKPAIIPGRNNENRVALYFYLGATTHYDVRHNTIGGHTVQDRGVFELSLQLGPDESPYLFLDEHNRQRGHHWVARHQDDRKWTSNSYEFDKHSLIRKHNDDVTHYDGLDRVDSLTRPGFSQSWKRDSAGNWIQLVEQQNGTTVLDQVRNHNPANEITALSNRTGPAWATVQYDAPSQPTLGNGNITQFPHALTPAKAMKAKYDAWNRLVEITDGTQLLRYDYDGLGRRIRKVTKQNGIIKESRHYYYSKDNQVISEYVENDQTGGHYDLDCQYIWGLRGTNDLICRFRDIKPEDNPGERHSALDDGEGHVTAVKTATDTNKPTETIQYDANGLPTFIDTKTGTSSTTSQLEWDTLFGGMRWEPDAGIYWSGAAIYHPRLGRTLQSRHWSAPNRLLHLQPVDQFALPPNYIPNPREETSTERTWGERGQAIAVTGGTAAGVTAVNVAAWSVGGPVLGIPTTLFTFVIGGGIAFEARDRQMMQFQNRHLSLAEGVGYVAADMSGYSTISQIGSGKEFMTGAALSDDDRLEMGLHFAASMIAGYAAKVGTARGIHTGQVLAVGDEINLHTAWTVSGYTRRYGGSFTRVIPRNQSKFKNFFRNLRRRKTTNATENPTKARASGPPGWSNDMDLALYIDDLPEMTRIALANEINVRTGVRLIDPTTGHGVFGKYSQYPVEGPRRLSFYVNRNGTFIAGKAKFRPGYPNAPNMRGSISSSWFSVPIGLQSPGVDEF